MLDEYVPLATSGNRTSVDIDATAADVWQALNELTIRECKITSTLMAVRSIPGFVSRRGELGRSRPGPGHEHRTMVAAMTSSRFGILHIEPPQLLVLGIVGQFWKPAGGVDIEIADGRAFMDFDEPGYVKSAIDFVVEPTPTGTRLATETRNQPTDEIAARSFDRYWKLVGWGSKVTRLDMLRAVRRRAER